MHFQLVQVLLGIHLGEWREQDQVKQAFSFVHNEFQGWKMFGFDIIIVFFLEIRWKKEVFADSFREASHKFKFGRNFNKVKCAWNFLSNNKKYEIKRAVGLDKVAAELWDFKVKWLHFTFDSGNKTIGPIY
jgi:hypothetical protein